MQACEHPEDALPENFADALLTRKEASDYLASVGVRRKPSTLAKLFSIGADGPPCRHDGRRPLYPKRLLHEWGVRQLTQLRRSSRDPRRTTTGRASSQARQ
ncbi:MAG: hypothetical protein HY054_09830 [Proteobacteria bacterium]|nr:hypothetical protein [Pseudomonadota bacterium]